MRAKVKRHRHDTREWEDEVFARWHRRRAAPFVRFEAALKDRFNDEPIGRIVRWLLRLPRMPSFEDGSPDPIPDPWLHWHDPDQVCDEACPEWKGAAAPPSKKVAP